MAKKQTELEGRAADLFPFNEIIESNSMFTRREMLGIAGMAAVQKVRCKTRELVHERRGAHRIGKQGNCVFKSMRECRRGYLPPDEFFSFEGQVILHLWIRW